MLACYVHLISKFVGLEIDGYSNKSDIAINWVLMFVVALILRLCANLCRSGGASIGDG